MGRAWGKRNSSQDKSLIYENISMHQSRT